MGHTINHQLQFDASFLGGRSQDADQENRCQPRRNAGTGPARPELREPPHPGSAEIVRVPTSDDSLRISQTDGIRVGERTQGPVCDCEIAVVNRGRFEPERKARYVWNWVSPGVRYRQRNVEDKRAARRVTAGGRSAAVVVKAKDCVSSGGCCHQKKAAD